MDEFLIMDNHSKNKIAMLGSKSLESKYSDVLDSKHVKNKLIARILEKAISNNVSVHEDTELLAMLAKIDFVKSIPSEYYDLMAKIIGHIYELEKKELNKNFAIN